MLASVYFALYEFLKFVCPVRILHDLEEMDQLHHLLNSEDAWYEVWRPSGMAWQLIDWWCAHSNQ